MMAHNIATTGGQKPGYYIDNNLGMRALKLGKVRYANEWADSGLGTIASPWMNGMYNAYNDFVSTDIGSIFFPPGRYYEDQTLVHDAALGTSKPRHLNILGVGFWDSIIKLADAKNTELITVDNSNSLFLNRVTLDGNKANQTIAKPLIHLIHTLDVTIEHCGLFNSEGQGILLSKAWTTKILSTPIEANLGHGIEMNADGGNTQHVDINFCTIADNAGHAIYMNRITDGIAVISINQNWISSTANHLIHVGLGASFIDIVHNYLTCAGFTAIEGRSGPDNISILDNKVYDVDTFVDTVGAGSCDRWQVVNNILHTVTTPFTLPSTMRTKSRIGPNVGQMIGVYNHSFEGGGTPRIRPVYGVGANVPVANTVYEIALGPVRIISTDSGGNDCNIEVKDESGVVIETGLSTYDQWLQPGWTIGWGNFTGADPTVTTLFL